MPEDETRWRWRRLLLPLPLLNFTTTSGTGRILSPQSRFCFVPPPPPPFVCLTPSPSALFLTGLSAAPVVKPFTQLTYKHEFHRPQTILDLFPPPPPPRYEAPGLATSPPPPPLPWKHKQDSGKSVAAAWNVGNQEGRQVSYLCDLCTLSPPPGNLSKIPAIA